MLQERPRPSAVCQHDLGDEPTQPRLLSLTSTGRVVAARSCGASTMLLDERGNLHLCSSGRETTVLSPEEAFDLLDFLYAQRDFLATHSFEEMLRRKGKESEKS